MSPKHAPAPDSGAQDLKKIEKIIEIIYEDLTGKAEKYKVSELLKAIELKRKLAPTDDREKQFWSMINGIRRDTLAHKNKQASDRQANGASRKSSQDE